MIISFLGFYVGFMWLGSMSWEYFHGLIMGAVAWFIAKVFDNAMDKRYLRVYEEVTQVVNNALQKDEKKAHVAVEFHASEVPGREGKFGRRYQFVVRRDVSRGEGTVGRKHQLVVRRAASRPTKEIV